MHRWGTECPGLWGKESSQGFCEQWRQVIGPHTLARSYRLATALLFSTLNRVLSYGQPNWKHARRWGKVSQQAEFSMTKLTLNKAIRSRVWEMVQYSGCHTSMTMWISFSNTDKMQAGCNPSILEVVTGILLGSLTSQLSLVESWESVKRHCFKTTKQNKIPKNKVNGAWGIPEIDLCHIHVNVYQYTHIHTHTHTL